MVKAAIFDLDDTLILERHYIESGYYHIAGILNSRFGLPTEEVFIGLMALLEENPKNVFNRFLDGHGIKYTKEIILNLVNEYRNHFPQIAFCDDVLPCLQLLKTNNFKLGIITDGYAICQRQKLKAVNAYQHFDEIIITDELGCEYWKPNPRSFELIRERLNVDFNEMIYVGDNPEKDFYINSIYPIKTIRIYREGFYHSSTYLKDIKETYAINNLLEIGRIINMVGWPFAEG